MALIINIIHTKVVELERIIMNILKKLTSVWFGIFVLSCVLYFGVFKGFNDITIFFNHHALILVFGGTLAVALLSYSFSTLVEIFDFLLYGFLLKKKNNMSAPIENFLAAVYEIKAEAKTPDQIKTEHLFVKDALRIVHDPKYNSDDAESILNGIKDSFYKRYYEQGKILSNISKFPPALGLLGASTGMIQMMMNLGTGGAAAIGSAMAVALTATFWGIAIANFFFLPLSDYASKLAEEDLYMRGTIIDGVILLKENAAYHIVLESLCGRLPVIDRYEILNKISKDCNIYFDTENAIKQNSPLQANKENNLKIVANGND